MVGCQKDHRKNIIARDMEDREVQFRTVKQEDLHFVFLLLQQLNKIDYSLRSLNECWDKFINNNSSNSIVGICNGKIVAYGSIIIENKIRGELAGHVEDIVVDKKNRGKKTGIKLISELVKIAKSKKCYRVTLTCDNSLIKFYKKNGFIINNIAMKKYINL